MNLFACVCVCGGGGVVRAWLGVDSEVVLAIISMYIEICECILK